MGARKARRARAKSTEIRSAGQVLREFEDALATFAEAGSGGRSAKLCTGVSSDELLELMGSLGETGVDETTFRRVVDVVLQHTVKTSHPLFLDKLYARPDATGVLGDFLTTLANTNVHTYSVAPVFAAAEVAVVREITTRLGFGAGSDGVFCPGGSHCNLTALVAARHNAFPNAKRDGVPASAKPVVFASEQCHFSVQRAAMIAGLGTAAVVPVRADMLGRMCVSDLRRKADAAVASGATPLMISATAGTTVMGGFDDLRALREVATQTGAWLHVDGAWGGLAFLSDRHKRLMDGVDAVDSAAFSFHKMAGMPIQCSAVVVNGHPGLLERAASTGADYLFHDHPERAFDIGDRTLQCGRRGDALKLWLAWRRDGVASTAARVDKAVTTARAFQLEIERRAREDGAVFPVLGRGLQWTNVPFFVVPRSLRPSVRAVAADLGLGVEGSDDPAAASWETAQSQVGSFVTLRDCPAGALDEGLRASLGRVTSRTYEVLRRRGRLLVNYNPLEGHGLPHFFRAVFNSPAVEASDAPTIVGEMVAAVDDVAL